MRVAAAVLLGLVAASPRPSDDPATFRLLASFDSHRDAPRRLVFSPDRKHLVSIATDGVRVWEVPSFRTVAVVEDVVAADLDPASGDLAVVRRSAPKTLELLDVPSLKRRKTCDVPEEGNRFEFVGETRKLLVYAGLPTILDPATGKMEKDVWPEAGGARAILPGKGVVGFAVSGEIKVYRLPGGQPRKPLVWEGIIAERGQWDRDGKMLVAASGSKVRAWDGSTGKDAVTDDVEGYVAGVAMHPQGKFAAAASQNGMLTLLDLGKGQRAAQEFAHEGGAETVAFSPDGKTLATAGKDRTIRLWTAAAKPAGDNGGPYDAAFVGAGATAHVVDVRGCVRSVGTEPPAIGKPGPPRAGGVVAFAVSPDGSVSATAWLDGAFVVRRTADGGDAWKASEPVSGAKEIRFSPDGAAIYVAAGSELKRFAATGGAGKTLYLDPKAAISAIDVSPDGKRVLVVDPTSLHLVDAESGAARVVERLNPCKAGQARFLADGTAVVRVDEGKAAVLSVNLVETSALEHQVDGRPVAMTGAFALHSGGALATAGPKTILVWNLEAGKVVHELPVREVVKDLAFTRDGKHLVAVTEGGNVSVYGGAAGK